MDRAKPDEILRKMDVVTERVIAACQEITRLRADLDHMHDEMDAARDAETAALQEVDRLRAELEAAVADIVKLLDDAPTCDFCGDTTCYRKGGTRQTCEPIWRGLDGR